MGVEGEFSSAHDLGFKTSARLTQAALNKGDEETPGNRQQQDTKTLSSV